MKNRDNDYVIVQFISEKEIKTYKHYRHPATGTLANSGKIELIKVEKIKRRKGK